MDDMKGIAMHEVSKIQETPVRVVRLTAECTCGGQYQFRHKLLNGDLVHLCTHCSQTKKLEARYHVYSTLTKISILNWIRTRIDHPRSSTGF